MSLASTWVTGDPTWNQAWARGFVGESLVNGSLHMGPFGLSRNEQNGCAFLWAHHLLEEGPNESGA